ncbi:MAG: FAD-dependent oxidoreductase [Rhodovulum sulfidophilum]|uniref:FAD-dependent oxidoreductase n=1 Tax=Rhodovulum sulfidophilum TaxID=35806 RepID=A0A2W5N5W0_RHOSU|nr:MAG: FAD-dependent oxidoreductase [Rhodovulum sulfidophilum]
MPSSSTRRPSGGEGGLPLGRGLDLRGGRPVWSPYRAPRVPSGKLTRDVTTDVLVIGMGISGAMIAEALTAEGHAVVMIDRRGPIEGSTAATTALVQYEIDTPLTRLVRRVGRERAERAWRRSRLAVANLGARIEELGIRCDLATRPSLYLAGDQLSGSGLRAEAEARRAIGIEARYLTEGALRERFGIAGGGAIVSPGNLALDPRKLAAGLMRAAIARGARAYAPAEALDFKRAPGALRVETAGGPVITAKHAVLATGYELAAIVPSDRHQIISTWAIATAPQKARIWPEAALIWQAAEPYLYLRATADGRVICGGEDEALRDPDARDALIGAKAARLSEKLGKLMPGLDPTPEFAWSGFFGESMTGLPLITRLPGHPRVHAVLGAGGNGITFSRIAAELIATELRGDRDADAGVFRASGD